MIDRRSPTEKILHHDAEAIETAAGGKIDLAMVLGSGLSSIVGGRFEHKAIAYDRMLGLPVTNLEGHAGQALVGTWHGKKIAVFAGRVHLYQGFSAQQVTTSVRLAHAAGAKTMILTNAAAAVDETLKPGDVMMITDHINMTGRNPLIGVPVDNPFVDMSNAYSRKLIELAQSVAPSKDHLREGVYCGVMGPSYETPAEVRFIQHAGAQALGMSTVLETILARSLGMDVVGASVIANVAGRSTTHSQVVAAASTGGALLGSILDGLIKAL